MTTLDLIVALALILLVGHMGDSDHVQRPQVYMLSLAYQSMCYIVIITLVSISVLSNRVCSLEHGVVRLSH
jgi:hypothetical protein